MTTAKTITPGYNCRLGIFFKTDKNGRRRAYYIGHNVFRAIPLPVADAELFLATEQADRIG